PMPNGLGGGGGRQEIAEPVPRRRGAYKTQTDEARLPGIAVRSDLARAVALIVEFGDHGLVNANVHLHLVQVRNAHELLTFAHRLALSDDGLLRAAAEAALLGQVVDDQAVLRRRNSAFVDLLTNFLELGAFLLKDLRLGVAIRFELVFFGGGLLANT